VIVNPSLLLEGTLLVKCVRCVFSRSLHSPALPPAIPVTTSRCPVRTCSHSERTNVHDATDELIASRRLKRVAVYQHRILQYV